jgi:hypothetical protein
MFVLASRWGFLKHLFKAFDDQIDDGVRGVRFPYIPIGQFLRSYPEYQNIFWIILFSCIAFSALYFVFDKYGLPKKKYIAFLSLGVLGICISYLIGVDQTIKSNPLLQMVRNSSTSVDIQYAFCGENYGSYDIQNDILAICSTAHDGKSTFSSRESTIRHEVWHVIQACDHAGQVGKWGEISTIEGHSLDELPLPAEVISALETYSADDKLLEAQAFRAETYLSDYLIQQEFKTYCTK